MTDAHIRPAEAFIQGLVAQRATDPAEAAPRRRGNAGGIPWLTGGITVALVALFAAELAFGIAQPEGSPVPTTWTLLAFGGASGDLVFNNGQWPRLLSAPLVHANALHLVLNCISLLIVGSAVERAVGPVRLGATFVLGALGGALASVTFNTPETLTVGASGAIMALAALALVTSFHFPPGDRRHSRLLISALLVLASSVAPMGSTAFGLKIDTAAHLGGIASGLVIGLVLRRGWLHTQARPRFGRLAMAVALAGLFGLIAPAGLLAVQYPYWDIAAQFVPAAELPNTPDEIAARAADVAARYPRDPRARVMHAMALKDAGDMDGAEKALRAALVEEDLWTPLLSQDVRIVLRATLAEIVMETRPGEAREIARPVCGQTALPEARRILDDAKFCGP
jgi:rhomboid protease GluP